jgi:ABC-type glycerol-3-phosphate transport system permease component
MIALMVVPLWCWSCRCFLLGAELNLIDTFRLVIAIYVGLMMPFSIYMLTSFFRTIPMSLIEAAEIDGASAFQILPARRATALRGAAVIKRSPSSTSCGSGMSS